VTPTQTTLQDHNAVNNGLLFAPSATIPGATPTRVVFTYSGAATRPQLLQIGTGTDANLRSSGIGSGSIYWAEANGTTNWANDDINSFPAAMLLIDDQVAAGGMVVHPGMVGGMRG
jgi:hypothetical protein